MHVWSTHSTPGLQTELHPCAATLAEYDLPVHAAVVTRTGHAVQVTDGGQPVNALNELEWVEGEVWANIWLTDCIARIDPASGTVKCASLARP